MLNQGTIIDPVYLLTSLWMNVVDLHLEQNGSLFTAIACCEEKNVMQSPPTGLLCCHYPLLATQDFEGREPQSIAAKIKPSRRGAFDAVLGAFASLQGSCGRPLYLLKAPIVLPNHI